MLQTALCLVAAFSSLAAETIVDQQFTPPDNFVRLDTQIGVPSHYAGAQTFIPGVSGQLAAVDFWVQLIGDSTTANVRVDLRTTTAAGAPGSSLGSVLVPPSVISGQSGSYKQISLSEKNITLTAGERYAIVFTAEPYNQNPFSGYDFRGHAQSQLGGNYDYLPGQGWLTENGQDWNTYAGSDFDYVFRTHMVVPEPRVIYLLLPGLLLFTYLNRAPPRLDLLNHQWPHDRVYCPAISASLHLPPALTSA